MSYEKLRQEFTRESFREEMVRTLGCTCFNCGSDDNIEYHHIVPLKLGGTNRFTNIVPLCHKCHVAAHTGRNIKDIKSVPVKRGRPRKWTLTMKNEMLLWMYARGEIGMKELRKRTGMANSRVKLKDALMYKEFIDKHKIDYIRNTYDIVDRKAKYGSTHITSVIYYKNRQVEKHEFTFVKKKGMADFENCGKTEIVETDHGFRYNFA